MNHLVLVLYILCLVLDSAVILISSLLYKEHGHRVFKYLAWLMFGAMLSMLVEALRTYGSLIPVDLAAIDYIVYLILDPAGEVLQFLLLPLTAYAAVGKSFPPRFKVFCRIYALLVIATFPLEVIIGGRGINIAREVAGHFVFHIIAYLVIVRNLREIADTQLRKVLKRYLALGIAIIPTALLYQVVVLLSFLPAESASIPFPYILYCLLFNLLCLVNTYRYLFSSPVHESAGLNELFVNTYHITNREREIIEYLLKGYSNLQIAKDLFISAPTVKNHIYHIYRKVDVENRMQLVRRITEIGGRV